MTMFIPLTAILLWMLPREGFPEIERTETLIAIDWNEPIDAIENRKRITDILNVNASVIHISECEVGYQQFLLSRQTYSVQHAQLYFAFKSQAEKEKVDLVLEKYLLAKFPLATVEFTAAPNAFEQLFATEQPQLEARFRDVRSKQALTIAQSDSLIKAIKKNLKPKTGKGFETETMAFIHFNFNNIKTYGLNYQDIINPLKIAFGDHVITNFKDFGEVTPVVFDRQPGDFDSAIKAIEVTSKEGVRYAIKDFVTIEYRENYKNITADASGIYQSVSVDDFDDVHTVEATVTEIAKKLALTVDYTGQWFETRDNFEKLTVIMIISLLLMYFILTAEFESLKQPLLVMITFPIGFAGSLILLWLTGGSLNIMSGIGFVVVLGILDNDAILKIDRINRLRETLPLEQAIKQAGLDRLKPIVMNTCTNVLAITPIIFSSGIGADLQRPVAITTIGGLIVGTFTALYFVPLVYWFISKENKHYTD